MSAPKKVMWGKKKTTSTTTQPPPTPGSQTVSFSIDLDLPSIKTIGSLENTSQKILADAEKPPDHVVDVYTDDYNILELDEIIRRRFAYNQKSKLEECQRRLAMEKLTLSRPCNGVELKTAQANIKQFESEIAALTSSRDLIKYQAESHELLELYKEIGTKRKVISFRQVNKEVKKDDDDEFRHLIIARYLEVARKYIPLDVTREVAHNDNCPGCNEPLEEVAIDDDTIVQCCAPCGVLKYSLTRSNVSGESTKSNNNMYDDQENFQKALRRYQGKQQNTIPESLYDELDDYFRSYDLPTSEEVLAEPVNERGTRGKTTREQMYRALLAIRKMAYYEDVSLLGNLYWGWVLPDVSHLEDQVLEDYSKTQRIYETLEKSKRKSNLNIQYRLFKHLEMRKHKCHIDDFKMVKTRDILEYHDAMWKKIIEKAKEMYPDDGFVFIATI